MEEKHLTVRVMFDGLTVVELRDDAFVGEMLKEIASSSKGSKVKKLWIELKFGDLWTLARSDRLDLVIETLQKAAT